MLKYIISRLVVYTIDSTLNEDSILSFWYLLLYLDLIYELCPSKLLPNTIPWDYFRIFKGMLLILSRLFKRNNFMLKTA